MITTFAPSDRIPGLPPLSIRMSSFLDAYGIDRPFARFWRTEHGLVSLVDGAATVIVGQGDAEEVRAFLAMLGAHSVLSDRPLLTTQHAIPVYHKAVSGRAAALPAPDYKAAYRLLSGTFALPPFEHWYVDACHRVRHGAALLAQEEHGALFAARSGSLLLLTGLVVDPARRRQGVATRLLYAVCLPDVTEIYAIVETEEAASFYTRAGFAPCGEVYSYEKGAAHDS